MIMNNKGIVVNKEGPSFSDRVVEAALSIPKGQVTTYGDLARAAGGPPMACRSVSGILAKATKKGVKDIPWHRIVYAEGRIWIDSDHHVQRMKLYKKEGIEVGSKGKIINFSQIRYTF